MLNAKRDRHMNLNVVCSHHIESNGFKTQLVYPQVSMKLMLKTQCAHFEKQNTAITSLS